MFLTEKSAKDAFRTNMSAKETELQQEMQM